MLCDREEAPPPASALTAAAPFDPMVLDTAVLTERTESDAGRPPISLLRLMLPFLDALFRGWEEHELFLEKEPPAPAVEQEALRPISDAPPLAAACRSDGSGDPLSSSPASSLKRLIVSDFLASGLYASPSSNVRNFL
jgi:hypothetical protein